MDMNTLMVKALFYGLAVVTLGSAMAVTFSRNLVRSAFALFFTLMGMAGLFVFLSADFVAIMQILVYAGGILVLILFGVWLTHRIASVEIHVGRIHTLPGVILGIGLMVALTILIRSFPWSPFQDIAARGTAHSVGHLLLKDYMLPFEASTVALLVALIGAIVIGRREEKDS